ncbi:hypothetical protein Glove_326g134 [Diversispora epigaea]|uniref:Dol-P-Man:Man(5)GlcNAc(2)-PP-Dol alpha-1,3-mannosyltransferase n=1 Tax=Diversispora epigaea TaxID=1348612 RepID=A0A397HM44_9GLOM|nr:hypothetical protein Glove_326g134 [Diversispora epigaea]
MNTDNEENKNFRPVIPTEELTLTTISHKLLRLVRSFLFDPEFFWYTGSCLLLMEIIFNVLIIKYVSYTEIDWKAYMQEVKIFLNGERDYMKLIGDTGPCVYPAGFIYIYSALYYITSGGIEIQKAQYLFAIIYLWTLFTVFNIYHKSRRIPPYVLILICLSKRLHSIYVLRLFNDTITMAFLYTCIWTLINKQWKLSCVLYSLALSVKMNVLLFFPAFGILLFKTLGAWRTFFHLAIIGLIQIILGYPFIATYPQSYLKRSFEFSRVFIYKWTVNWKFFDEMTFESIGFSNSLLIGHVCVLSLFLFRRWCRKDNGVISLLVRGFVGKREELDRQVKNVTADHITTLMLTSNFIGIIFSRTLHYQFYSWYFHGLPFLLWNCIKLPVPFRFLILAVIEYCWNVYPSTSESSLLLLICHLIILVGLWSSEDLANPSPTCNKCKLPKFSIKDAADLVQKCSVISFEIVAKNNKHHNIINNVFIQLLGNMPFMTLTASAKIFPENIHLCVGLTAVWFFCQKSAKFLAQISLAYCVSPYLFTSKFYLFYFI